MKATVIADSLRSPACVLQKYVIQVGQEISSHQRRKRCFVYVVNLQARMRLIPSLDLNPDTLEWLITLVGCGWIKWKNHTLYFQTTETIERYKYDIANTAMTKCILSELVNHSAHSGQNFLINGLRRGGSPS